MDNEKKLKIKSYLIDEGIEKEYTEQISEFFDKTPEYIREESYVVIGQYYTALIRLFGGAKKFIEIVDKQSYIDTIMDITPRKTTIFDIPMGELLDRIKYLEKTFGLTHDEFVELIEGKPDWIFHRQEYFEERIDNLISFFGKTRVQTINKIKSNYFMVGKRLNNVENRVERISELLECEKSQVRDLMFTYPVLMNWHVFDFKDLKLTNEIFDRPWLLECLVGRRNCNFGGYATFEGLCAYIKLVEEKFGKKEELIKVNYREGEFIALLLKNDKNERFLVSVGGSTATEKGVKDLLYLKRPEDKLLEAIFGVSANSVRLHTHKEYFMKIDDVADKDTMVSLLGAYALADRRTVHLRKDCSAYNLPLDYIKTEGIEQYITTEDLLDYIMVRFIAPYLASQGVLEPVVLKKEDEDTSSLDDLLNDMDLDDEDDFGDIFEDADDK